MIAKFLGQLLLASSVVQILPIDAASLEWRAGHSESITEPSNAASSWFATLPLAADRFTTPHKIDLDSYGIVTTAQSAIVVDAATGTVLYAEQPDNVRAIGSITKLMSVLVFLETEPDLAKRVTILPEDYVGGGRVYLRFDDAVTLRDVLRASLIGSDNTATQALTRFSGYSHEDFVQRMNAKADALGMTSTEYVDASGVGAGNVSTARDLTKILAAVETEPTMAATMPLREAVVTQASGYAVTVESTDELLRSYLNQGEYEIEAGKTGFIPQAGYCFATTVSRNGTAIRVVVLGADSKANRFSDAKGLAAWAFKTFSWE